MAELSTVATIGNKNSKDNTSKRKKWIKTNRNVSKRIVKIASGAAYRMDKQFQNLPIFGIKIVFQIEKNAENLLVISCKILETVNFPSCEILEIRYR